MALCLSDPVDGYYVKQDPFGAGGDFITAPEISQVFGELVGGWLVDVWHRAGAPDPVNLVELGPGRGTLMSDILRVARLDQAFRSALRIHLVEISPVLQERQRETLQPTGVAIDWHGSLADIPAGPMLLVANEFFDALPIRQHVGCNGEWRERLIGRSEDGLLTFMPGPGLLECALPADDGAIIETSPASSAVMDEVAARIGARGAAALIIDYGYVGPTAGETLQAVRNHLHVDPLADPGEADLTAHVDFAALKAACAGADVRCHGPIAQGDFLLALGLLERAGQLGRNKDDAARQSIRAAVERLAGAEQMGELFKVFAVTGAGVDPLPFATD